MNNERKRKKKYLIETPYGSFLSLPMTDRCGKHILWWMNHRHDVNIYSVVSRQEIVHDKPLHFHLLNKIKPTKLSQPALVGLWDIENRTESGPGFISIDTQKPPVLCLQSIRLYPYIYIYGYLER
jgi:hypothetical protein